MEEWSVGGQMPLQTRTSEAPTLHQSSERMGNLIFSA